MDSKKTARTWLLFAGAGALVLAGLALHLWPQRAAVEPPAPPLAVAPTPPAPVAEPAPTPPVLLAEPAPVQPPTPPAPDRPKIDLVFALDTTSSMTGLLEGAKQKIWSIASHIASGRPTPELRVGLVPYRDRGDAFVTRVYPLTTNLDEVYARLRTFKAEGGGDPPEDVRQALLDSIRRMNWTPGDKVMRVVFLVGDSPPQAYPGQPSEAAIAAEARRKGIRINTLRCGDLESTEQAWRTLARGARGSFATLSQDGGMVAVRTPLDDRLKELNTRLSETAVYYGGDEDRREAEARAETNRRMAEAAQAESARFRALSGHLDSSDLLTAVGEGRARLEDLPAAALPAPMQAMAPSERQAFVEGKRAARAKIAAEVLELSRQRDEYLRRARPAAPAFDEEVKGMVSKQAAGIGVAY